MGIVHATVSWSAGHPGQGPQQVDAFTLRNGALEATIWTYGATLVELRAPDRRGQRSNLVLRLPDLASYEDRTRNPYLGSVLGRYCRALAAGRLMLDDVTYQLDCNLGGHHLHGGEFGFDRYVWQAEAATDRGVPVLRLFLVSPDGDQGYPGELSVQVEYRLTGDTLVFEAHATTTAPTVVSLTNHAFWNLAGAGQIDRHQLSIDASTVLMTDSAFIPLPGPPVPVSRAGQDYRYPQQLGGRRIDHFFPLDSDFPRRQQVRAAVLFDPGSGRRLTIATDQPGLGVYTGEGLPVPRSGLCIQPSAWPDAPNRPDFPTARLDPGETYRHRTDYQFTLS
jgi:aldose 1-epimerase